MEEDRLPEGTGAAEIAIRCPNCRTRTIFRGEYRPELTAICGRCGEDVTIIFKREFFRGVAAEMNARIVEQENREFLRSLKRGLEEE